MLRCWLQSWEKLLKILNWWMKNRKSKWLWESQKWQVHIQASYKWRLKALKMGKRQYPKKDLIEMFKKTVVIGQLHRTHNCRIVLMFLRFITPKLPRLFLKILHLRRGIGWNCYKWRTGRRIRIILSTTFERK